MSRHFQFMLNGALVFLLGSFADSLVSAQDLLPPVAAPPIPIDFPVPPAVPGAWQAVGPPVPGALHDIVIPQPGYSAPFGFGSEEFQDQQMAVEDLKTKIQLGDLDESEEATTAAELKEGIASLFDLESKQLEEQVAQMQATIEKRKKDREKLVQGRVEKAINAPKVGEMTFHVHGVEKRQDGTSIARVALMRTEKLKMMVTTTKIRKETRKRTVDGKEQEYTVSVPETVAKERDRIVQVPAGQKEVSIPKGQDVNKTVKKFVDGLDDF